MVPEGMLDCELQIVGLLIQILYQILIQTNYQLSLKIWIVEMLVYRVSDYQACSVLIKKNKKVFNINYNFLDNNFI